MSEWGGFKGFTVFERQVPRMEKDCRMQIILKLAIKPEIASGRVLELGRCVESEH